MDQNGRHSHQELLPLEAEAPRRGMTRAQLMERILEINPTATPQFLGGFSESSLAHYLDHLCIADEPTIPWVRRGIAPAIVRRESRE